MYDFERLATYPPRSDHSAKPKMRRRHMLQGLTLLLLFATGSLGILHAEETKSQPQAMLDEIWPFELSHKRPLSKQDQEYAEAALIQWLEAYLHREYEVVDKRFFWSRRNDTAWGPMSKGHALYPENENGRWRVLEEIRQPWHDPGFDLVRIWKVSIDGKDHYFALAMTDKPVPGTNGRHLIGRFELKISD
jgi:hypothetical protein